MDYNSVFYFNILSSSILYSTEGNGLPTAFFNLSVILPNSTDVFHYPACAGYQTVGLDPDGGASTYVMLRPTIGQTNVITTADLAHTQSIITGMEISLPILQEEMGDYSIYDLQGRRVLNPQPGTIYIQNGKKLLYR